MGEWLIPALITGACGLASVIGAVIGYVISAKTARATAAQQVAATMASVEKTDTQLLVDQLQEELAGHRKTADERATAQDQRMERIEQENAVLRVEREGYRSYAHTLRDHITAQLPPPPPGWPTNLPR